jgi:hypothetical protein
LQHLVVPRSGEACFDKPFIITAAFAVFIFTSNRSTLVIQHKIIAAALQTITHQDAVNWFVSCGYSFI